jgi:hypothetical protein
MRPNKRFLILEDQICSDQKYRVSKIEKKHNT